MAEPVKSEFSAPSGLKLYAEHWKPAGAPVAALVFVHGLGDHCGRYAHAFKHFASAGIAVHTFDALGHGRSPALPKRGPHNIERFADLTTDAEAFATAALDSYPQPPPPAFIMGQSLGGLVAAHVALSSAQRFARGGLVLMSAAMDVEWTPILHVQAALGGVLSCLLPNAQLVPAVAPKDLSRDPAVVAAFEADPLVAHGQTKGRMAYESLCAFRRLGPRYKDFTLPLLAMHGTADKITSLSAVRRLVAAAQSRDKAMVEWPGAFHELLHEPEKQEVMDKLTAWMLERAGAPAKL